VRIKTFKGQTGDAMYALLCAAGYNIRLLLWMIRKRASASAFFGRLSRRWD
jgi:hypothetical protein